MNVAKLEVGSCGQGAGGVAGVFPLMMDFVYPKPQKGWPEPPLPPEPFICTAGWLTLTSGKGKTLLEDLTACPHLPGERDTVVPCLKWAFKYE